MRPRFYPLVIAALAVGFLAGMWSGGVLAKHSHAIRESPPAAEVPVNSNTERQNPTPMAKPDANRTTTGIVDLIAKEKALLMTPVEEYATLFQKELEDGTDYKEIFRIMRVWAERDPEGFIAWGMKQPGFLVRTQNGKYTISISDDIMRAVIRHYLDKAWELAARMPGSAGTHRWAIVNSLAEKDFPAALTLVRQHRDFLSANQGHFTPLNSQAPAPFLPLLEELAPGPTRSYFARVMARYHAENLSDVPESEAAAWFQKLPPDLRAETAEQVTEEQYYRISPEHLATLQRIWKVESPPPAEGQ